MQIDPPGGKIRSTASSAATIDDRILELIESGQHIQAIKVLVDDNHMSLRKAKIFVDELRGLANPPKPASGTTARKDSINTIRQVDGPNNRYLKQVFDHILANYRDKTFGYDDLPGDDLEAKSYVLVELKRLAAR